MKLERQNLIQAKLKAEVEIREQTLDYISRELHDNLGQIASVLKINLGLAAIESKAVSARLNECQDLIRYLISEIKSISLNLNSGSITKIGLVKALENDIDRVNKTGVVNINLIAPQDLTILGTETELLLYRMCQEALNNILQHSQATSASVKISSEPTELLIQIIDNGVGFEVQNKLKNSLGLTNFKERCKFIGASYSINSVPGLETKIEIVLPRKDS